MMAWYDIMTKSFLRKKERSIIALKIKKNDVRQTDHVHSIKANSLISTADKRGFL